MGVIETGLNSCSDLLLYLRARKIALKHKIFDFLYLKGKNKRSKYKSVQADERSYFIQLKKMLDISQMHNYNPLVD